MKALIAEMEPSIEKTRTKTFPPASGVTSRPATKTANRTNAGDSLRYQLQEVSFPSNV